MKNLPAPRTSFVGRASELDEIDRLLEDPDCRLLTLVGPGGAGKTRLALEAAGRRIERYPHGVHFVPARLGASPEFLPTAVAESIQFAPDGARGGFSAQEQLLDYLGERSTLLVLDNFEHLVEGADLLGEIIERAPKVELLTTSRERLNVQSEWVLDVHGLGFAENGNGSSGALRLFLERATKAEPGFSLDDDERVEALRICRLVEGLPLGIELAASWVSVLSCAEIADEIEQKHRLSRHVDARRPGAASQPPRGVRPVLASAFRRAAGCPRAVVGAARRLRTGGGRLGCRRRFAPALGSRVEVACPTLGLRPLRGTRAAAPILGEKLAAGLPDALATTRERHARHYLGLLAERRAALVGEGVVGARDGATTRARQSSLRCEWAVAGWAEDEAREVLAGLNEFFFAHSWFDGAGTFERLVSMAGGLDLASPVTLAAVTYRTALGSALGYEEELDRLALECLPRLRELGMTWELGWCLLALGTNGCYQDVYREAAEYLEEAVAVACSAGDGLTRRWCSCGWASCSCCSTISRVRGHPSMRPARRRSVSAIRRCSLRSQQARRLCRREKTLRGCDAPAGGGEGAVRRCRRRRRRRLRLDPRELQRVRDGRLRGRRCSSVMPATRRSARSTTVGA